MPLLLHSCHYKHQQSQVYTMISSRIQHLNTLQQAQRYPLFSQLSISSEPLDRSNQNCFCQVKSRLQIKIDCIIAQLSCRPKFGMFEGIDFKVKILLNYVDMNSKVSVYNDRRVFHPNVNLITCEITSKSITEHLKCIEVLNNQFGQFDNLTRHIMDIIVRPDCFFVADNPYNRKAAWHYTYNRENYADLIFQHCPSNLNIAIAGQYLHNRFEYLNSYSVSRMNRGSQRYWSIDCTIKKYKSLSISAWGICEQEADKQDFSSKRIKFQVGQETTSETMSAENCQVLQK